MIILKKLKFGTLDGNREENFYKNLDLFYKGKINNSFFIWKIINLDIWKNIH